MTALLARIRGTRLVITEALHGAILAHALQVPWIGITPFMLQHRGNWEDWAQSLDIALRPATLPPSSRLETYTLLSDQPGKGPRYRALFRGWPAAPLNLALIHLAARRLQRLAETTEPHLSSDRAIERPPRPPHAPSGRTSDYAPHFPRPGPLRRDPAPHRPIRSPPPVRRAQTRRPGCAAVRFGRDSVPGLSPLAGSQQQACVANTCRVSGARRSRVTLGRVERRRVRFSIWSGARCQLSTHRKGISGQGAATAPWRAVIAGEPGFHPVGLALPFGRGGVVQNVSLVDGAGKPGHPRFRSSVWPAERKLRDDPRITPVGAVLRSLSVDELLPLFNIPLGQMSVVTPRPFVA